MNKGIRILPKPLFMRLFFVALLTRFSAVLLPVTERRTDVLYYPLERTKRRVPMSGNSLAAPFALYTGCITNCIFRRLWDGRYAARIAVYGGFVRVVGRRHCYFGRRTAVRIAVCKQISERCFRAVNPPHQSFAKCEIFKWVSVLAYPCCMYIMGGLLG